MNGKMIKYSKNKKTQKDKTGGKEKLLYEEHVEVKRKKKENSTTTYLRQRWRRTIENGKISLQ